MANIEDKFKEFKPKGLHFSGHGVKNDFIVNELEKAIAGLRNNIAVNGSTKSRED
jgi:hypothetical protein